MSSKTELTSRHDSSFAVGVATCGSGVLSAVAAHPFDIIRARVLYGVDPVLVSSFHKGLPFTVALSVIKAGCVWPLQEKIQKMCREHEIHRVQSILFSGILSSVIPNVLMSPLNIVRIHLIRDHADVSLREITRNIYQTMGVTGFYQGFFSTIFRDSVWGGVYFICVDKIRHRVKRIDHPFDRTTVDAIATFSGAIIATTISSPIDSIRLHQINEDRCGKKSFVGWFKEVILPTKKNFFATTAGVLRVAIGTAVAHTSYRALHRWMD